jgi:hypothetical protein
MLSRVFVQNLVATMSLATLLGFVSGCNSTLQLGSDEGGAPPSKDGGTDSGHVAREAGRISDSAPSVDVGGDVGHRDSASGPDASHLPGDGGGGAILAALDVGEDDAGASCVQACSAVAGMAVQFGTVDAPDTVLVGSWRICSGSLGIGPANAIGVEFDTSGGSLYYLVAGPSGDPERGAGFAYQGTYESLFYDGATYLQIRTGADTVTYQPIYSPCPRQFWMAISSVMIP